MEDKLAPAAIAYHQKKFFGQKFVGAYMSQLSGDFCRYNINDFFEKKYGPLLISGPPGVGKTHALAAMTEKMILSFLHIVVSTESKIIEKISEYVFEGWRLEKVFESLFDYQLVVIDTFGNLISGSLELIIMKKAVEWILDNGKSVIISTDLSINDLNNIYGTDLCNLFSQNCNRIIDLTNAQNMRDLGF